MADRKFPFPEQLWAGTEHSLELAMEVHNELMAGGMFGAPNKPEDEDDAPYNFSMVGDIGVVTIKGPLVNRDSPYNRYAGVTSYADVRRAMIHAAKAEGAKAILLDIDSGGGAVAGLADTGDLVSMVSKIKPTYAFTDGVMASAAYWLGSSVGKGNVFVSSTAVSGSIGVITTHMEMSKMMKEMGIGVTVMRAGKYKALANSMEPLTEPAQKQVQAQLDSAYGIFANHVVAMRATSMETFEAKMGQGREFFGAAAVDAGIADGVTNFDKMISMISQKLIDTSAKAAHTPGNYQRGQSMSKEALTEQQVAALAAGAAPAAAGAPAAPVAPAAVEPTPAPAAAEAAAPAAEVSEPKDGNDQIVAFLKSELAAANASVVSLSADLAKTKDALTSLQASVPLLSKIAAKSVSNMKVALGLSAIDLTAMTPEALLAEHAATEATFTARFKAGQVSAASAQPAAAEPKVEADPAYLARVAATRMN